MRRTDGTSVRRVDGRPRWAVEVPEYSAWVEVEAESWPGYVFRVTLWNGQLIGFDIRRTDGAEALSATRLQRVPLGAIERCARDWIAGTADAAERDSLLGRVYADIAAPRASGERLVILAKLAAAYVETLDKPNQRTTLAARFLVSTDHLPNMVREARDNGLLLPRRPGRGRRVGYLSSRALELLGKPPRLTAWERATDEQRAAALAREARVAELDHQLYSGEITRDDYLKANEHLFEED